MGGFRPAYGAFVGSVGLLSKSVGSCVAVSVVSLNQQSPSSLLLSAYHGEFAQTLQSRFSHRAAPIAARAVPSTFVISVWYVNVFSGPSSLNSPLPPLASGSQYVVFAVQVSPILPGGGQIFDSKLAQSLLSFSHPQPLPPRFWWPSSAPFRYTSSCLLFSGWAAHRENVSPSIVSMHATQDPVWQLGSQTRLASDSSLNGTTHWPRARGTSASATSASVHRCNGTGGNRAHCAMGSGMRTRAARTHAPLTLAPHP